MEIDKPIIPSLEATFGWMQSHLISSTPWDQKALEKVVKPSSKLSAQQHLAIYRRSYFSRLRECMLVQFPALSYALGQALFLQFANLYLSQYPSQSYTLADLGYHFEQFLEENRPDKDQEEKEWWVDFMIQLANFEFKVNSKFDEKATEEYQSITDTNVANEQIQVLPIFELYEYDFPISLFYKEAINDKSPEQPLPQKSYTILLRRNYRLGVFELEPAQFHFLKALQETQSVSKSLEFLEKELHLDADELSYSWAVWKPAWIKEGFFILK